MHILIVTSIYPNNAFPSRGVFTHEQAKALARKGVRVGVLFPNYPHPKRIIRGKYPVKDILKEYEYDGIPVISFPFFPFPYIHNNFTNIISRKFLKRYIKKFGRPDIIHSHFIFYGGVIGVAMGKSFGIPTCVTLHSTQLANLEYKDYKYKVTRSVLEGANKIISVSNFLAERSKQYSKNTEPIIIPNIVDTKFLIPQSGIKRDPFTFTSIGSLIKRKNVSNLLMAFAKISADHEFRLNIVGGGDQFMELKKLSDQLGISERVHFSGPVGRQELNAILSKTSVVVSSSDLETFGVTLIEALAMGIPVLSTRSGGPEEIVTPENGILVEKDDVAALAEGMKRIFREYARFDPKKIREDCIAKYGYATVAEKLIATYKDVLAGN